MKGDLLLRDWASQSPCGIQATVWGFPGEVLNHSQVSYTSRVTLEDWIHTVARGTRRTVTVKACVWGQAGKRMDRSA